MGRNRRKYVDSEIYHLIIRGNNKQNIFYDDKDRYFMINRIEKYAKQLSIKIFAYCLMSNHVHIMVGKANKNLSKFMLKLNTSYSRTFNLKYDRTGHLFQGRYLSNPIENNTEFKTVIRYILQNPLKAGMTKIIDYKWSSYKVVKNNEKSFIDKEFIYSIFDNIINFNKFISLDNQDICMEYENKGFMSDGLCYQMIKKILNIDNPHLIIRGSIKEQKESVRKLKERGLSINKISRITGISRYIIKSA